MDVLIPWLVAWTLGVSAALFLTRDLPPAQRRFILQLLTAGLLLRLLVATIFAVVPSTRVFHEDASGEEFYAMALATRWHGGPQVLIPFTSRNSGLIYVFGGFMYLFGVFRLNATVFNSLIGTLSILIVFRIGRHLFQDVVARRGAILACFFPSMIIWSAIAIKDALMGCMVLVSLLFCIRLRERFSAWNLVGILIPLFVVYPIRFYLVYFMLFSIVGTMTLGRRGRALSGLSTQLLIVAMVVGIVVSFGLGGYAREDSKYMDLDVISHYRHGMMISANSGFGQDADISSPLGAALFLPIGLLHLVWSPFPWQMFSLRPLLTLPEMVIWWLAAPALVRGLVYVCRRRFTEFAPLIVFTATLLIGYSLTMGNVGAAFRMRAQVFTLLFLFASLGYYLKRCHQRGIEDELLFRRVS